MHECVNKNHQDYKRLVSYLGGQFNVDRLFADYGVEVEELTKKDIPLRGDKNWPNSEFIREWVDGNINFAENTKGSGKDFVMSRKDYWNMQIDHAYNKTEGDLAVEQDYLNRVQPAYSVNFAGRKEGKVMSSQHELRSRSFQGEFGGDKKALTEELVARANKLSKVSTAFKEEYEENRKKGLRTVTQEVTGEEKEGKAHEATFSTETGTFTHGLMEVVHSLGKESTHKDRVDELMRHWDKERGKNDNPLYIEKDEDARRMCEKITDMYEEINKKYEIVSMEAPVVLHSTEDGSPILGRCDIIALDKETGQGVLIDIKTHVENELPAEGEYNKFFQNYNLKPVGNGEHTAWDHANVQTMGYAAAFNKMQPGSIERRGMIQIVIKGDPSTGHVSDFALNTPRDTECHNGVIEMYDSAAYIHQAAAAFKEADLNVDSKVQEWEQNLTELRKFERQEAYHAMESLSQEETYKAPLRWASGLNIGSDPAAVFKSAQLLSENFTKKLERGLTSVEQIADMVDMVNKITSTARKVCEIETGSNISMFERYGIDVLKLQKGEELNNFMSVVQEQQRWLQQNADRCDRALQKAMHNYFDTYVAPDIKEALIQMGPMRKLMNEEYTKLWKENKANRASKAKWMFKGESFRMQFKNQAYERAMERYQGNADVYNAEIDKMVNFLAGFSDTYGSITIYDGWKQMLNHNRGWLTGALMALPEKLGLDRLIATPNLCIQEVVKGIEMGHATTAQHNRRAIRDYEKLDKEIMKLGGVGAIHGAIDFRKVYDFCLDFKEIEDGRGGRTVKGTIIKEFDYDRYNKDLAAAKENNTEADFNKTNRSFKGGITSTEAYQKIADKCKEEITALADRIAIMDREIAPIINEEGGEDMEGRTASEKNYLLNLLEANDQYGLNIFSPDFSANDTKGVAYIKNMAHKMLEDMYVPSDEYRTEKYKKLMELPENHAYRRFYDRIARTTERYDSFVPDQKRLGSNLPVSFASSREGVGMFAREGLIHGWFSSNTLEKHYKEEIQKENEAKGKPSTQVSTRDPNDPTITVRLPMSGYSIDPDIQSYNLSSIYAKLECSLNNYMVMNPLMAQFKVLHSMWDNINLGKNKIGDTIVGLKEKDLKDCRDNIRKMIEGSYTDSKWGRFWKNHFMPAASFMTIGYNINSQWKSHFASLGSIFNRYPDYFKPTVYARCYADARMLGVPNQLANVFNSIFMPDKPKMSDIRTFFGFQDEELIRSLPHFHELEKSIQGTLASSIRDIAYAGYSISDRILQTDVCNGLAHSCDVFDANGKAIGSLMNNIYKDKKTGELVLDDKVHSIKYNNGQEVRIDGEKFTKRDLLESLQRTAKMIMSNTTAPTSIFYSPTKKTEGDVGTSTLMIKQIPINLMTSAMEQYRYDLASQTERIGLMEALGYKDASFIDKAQALARGFTKFVPVFKMLDGFLDRDDRLPPRERIPTEVRQQLETLGFMLFSYCSLGYLTYQTNDKYWWHGAKNLIKGMKEGGMEQGIENYGDWAENVKDATKEEKENPPATIFDYIGVGQMPHRFFGNLVGVDDDNLPEAKDTERLKDYMKGLLLLSLTGERGGPNIIDDVKTALESGEVTCNETFINSAIKPFQAAQQFFKNKLTGKETVTTQNDPYQDWPKWYKTLYLCFPQINAFDKARKIEVPAKFEE